MSLNMTKEQQVQATQKLAEPGRTPAAALFEALDVAQEKADPLNDELQAMRSVARTLEKLPRDAQDRVVTWLCNRLPPRFEGLGGRLGG
jgi:hypothetical protein